jgi:hypothetical protein
MQLPSVDRFPIVVFANFRTGSTHLASYLAKTYNLKFFDEPFYRVNDTHKRKYVGISTEFNEFYNSGNPNYVVKFMPNQICAGSHYEHILASSAYKIRLTRNNIIDTITSFYIATSRKKFHRFLDDDSERFHIELDYKMMLSSINLIRNNDFILRKLNIEYDLTLTYEDIFTKYDIPETITLPYDKPENYTEIHEKISAIYKAIN